MASFIFPSGEPYIYRPERSARRRKIDRIILDLADALGLEHVTRGAGMHADVIYSIDGGQEWHQGIDVIGKIAALLAKKTKAASVDN